MRRKDSRNPVCLTLSSIGNVSHYRCIFTSTLTTICAPDTILVSLLLLNHIRVFSVTGIFHLDWFRNYLHLRAAIDAYPKRLLQESNLHHAHHISYLAQMIVYVIYELLEEGDIERRSELEHLLLLATELTTCRWAMSAFCNSLLLNQVHGVSLSRFLYLVAI